MKSVKWLLLVMLALTIVVAGCSSGNGTETTTPPAETPKEETPKEAEAEPEPEPEPEKPALNLNGRTIRVAAWWDDKPKGETADEIARLEKMAELEKAYNFTFEFINVPFEEYMDKFTTSVLSGEPFADVAIMEYKRAAVPVKSGLVLPISEFAAADSDINNDGRLVRKLPPLGGEEYSFSSPGVSIVGIHYNREIFNQLGLPDPQDLLDSGEWTWDKFLEIAKNATRDTNNDGTPDTYGYSGWAADTARHFAAANGIAFVDGNTMTDNSTDPKTIEALEFVNRLYNTENVVKVKSDNPMDWNETNTFKDGDVAMSLQYDWNIGDLSFEAGVVPLPAGPNSDGKHTFANTALNGWFIPKGVENPADVYRIFEEMRDVPSTEEYVGQDWLEGRYKTERDIQIALDKINGTGMISIEEGVPDHPFFAIMDEIIIQKQSVTATVESHKQAAQDAIANLGS